MSTIDDKLEEVTRKFLENNQLSTLSPSNIKSMILDQVSIEFQFENAILRQNKIKEWRIPQKLIPAQIADILLHKYHIKKLALAGLDNSSEYDILGLYQTEGVNEGLYITNQEEFERLILQYDYTIDSRGIKNVLDKLQVLAERTVCCNDKDLIAVQNGIFDYKNKTLLPFSPDLVFTAKSKVKYKPFVQKVVIHNSTDGTDWDVDSWIADLFDDPEVEQLIWELMGAALRPNVPWNKSAWFLSEMGNNGKGTLCELMRQLLGAGTHTSITLLDFAKDFMLTPLITANAVIVDENSVGIFIDSADNLKAAITGDVIMVNRKFKDPVAIKFRGMIVQCVNEVPRVRDRSQSFMRRFLIIPFNKCFTGRERKYIKEDYLKRPEVLEYVLHKVLNMDYYELSNPTACVRAMEDFRLYNGPVEQFIEEILPQCRWGILPNDFLYDLYCAWMERNCPNGMKLSKIQFLKELKIELKSSIEWDVPNSARDIGNKMNAAEPLIADYKLERWYNPSYRGDDLDKLCHPAPRKSCRGIVRK